jgi:signal transduction histidine kinase
MIVERLRSLAGRHPWAVDAGLAVLVAVANAPATAGAGTGWAGWWWFTAAHLPLVWRRRAPVAMFWTAFSVALAVWTVTSGDGPYPLVVVLVAVYAVARHRPLRQVWPAAAAVELTLAVTWQRGDLPWIDLASLTAILAATALLGMTVRMRQAHLAELEERARRLERERDQQAKLATAAERARIAREVHDIVAHNLAVMVALADGAALTAAAAPQRAADTLATVAITGRQALDEMQRLLGLLRDDRPVRTDSAGFSPQPGLDDLDGLVAQVRGAGMQVVLTREGAPRAWGPGAELAIYRIVQEALTNSLKHAGPNANAQVRVRYRSTGVDLEITDDGAEQPVQLPLDPPVGGHGLAGMSERARAYGGRVEAGPLPGAGWRVHAQLHFNHREGSA